MASGLFSSIQSLSTKLLEAIRSTPSTSHQQQDPSSPVTDQHKNVRDDLEKLSRMFRRIQAVLQDAEEREIHECSVRLWLAELRGVAYQTEDVLDEFYYEVQRSIVESGDAAMEAYHRDGGNERKIVEKYPSSALASRSSCITKISIPNGMAEKIKCITERFQEISNDRHALQLREDDGTRLVISQQIRPPTSSHVDEKAIFGREEEKEKVINLLNSSNGPNFIVLPIVGMGGFGKTTLAQLVFNDFRIHGLFNMRCWVSVSEDFDLVRITKAIVESVSKEPCEFSELNILQDVLKEKIKGHGLFLVLDDVWNEKRNLWECFRVGFLGAKFVSILTTTRNTSVAKIMQTTSPFQLSSLPKENCWSLFQHFAFGNRETSENANLRKIGRGIVKKCKGSPLAIKALGGLLRYEIDEEKWREILESDISEIDETGEIMPALRLSYQKLPQHLKPCFLYLSMFPKDTRFGKDMVVRLWMAQGYINGNTRNLRTLEEIGSEYFDELQGRSLVDGGPSFYILHDLIHDLARSVSQEAYWPVFENDQEYNGPCKVCHLYFTKQDELLGLVPNNYWSIRTFVAGYWSNNFDFAIFSEIACARALQLRNSLLPNTLGTLKHLRYLSVEDNKMEVLPETLCLLYNLQTLVLDCDFLGELPENMKNLSNLRYFELGSKKIWHLPESIFQLPNLQTLSLRYCDKLKELPRGIEKLTRLHILDLPRFHTNMPSGIRKLSTLQWLRGQFSVMGHDINGGLRVLKDMNKLRGSLCISGLRNIVDVGLCRNNNLASKPNLHRLILNFKDYCGMRGFRDGLHLHLTNHSRNNAKSENDEKIHNVVLESLQPHGNLTELKIFNYKGRVFPSWLLNSLLPKLTTLTLIRCTEPNYLPPFGQLPHLRILEISDCTGVRNLGDDSSEQPKKPSYPSLEELSLRNMLNLVEWQANDGNFPCLKELVLENCPELWKIPTIPQNVRDITFEDCPKLKFLTCPSVIRKLIILRCGFREITLHSVCKNLTISNCVVLISINLMDRGSNSVAKVRFECCPKLEHIPVKDVLRVDIYDCPILYLGERYVYQRDTTIKELNLSGNNAICLSDSTIPLQENQFKLFLTKEDFREVESLTCAPSVGVSCQHVILNLALLVILKITRCTNIISVTGLDNLSNLKYLSISFCPELCNWNDKTLPLSLKFLELNYCDKLSSLPLLSIQNHSNSLEVLVQTKCPRLDYLRERYVYQRDKTIKEFNLLGNNKINLSNSTIPLKENQFKLFLTKEGFREVESFSRAPSVGVSCQHVILNLASLVILEIRRCTKVISVTGLDNLSNLKRLSISYCSELCNWNDRTLPLSLESLQLLYCDMLSSLPLLSVQNHSSTLKDLVIKKCPRLAMLEGFHGPMKLNTVNLLLCEIYDCPRLYLGERYVYQRDTMIKELNLSGNNEIHLSDSAIPLLENQFKLFLTKEDFLEVESLTFAPSVGVSCQHVILNLGSLVILDIMRCTNIISVTGLDNLRNLKRLSISYCPELCNWNDTTLPLSLESLQLIYCDMLSSLPLLSVQNHSSTLKALAIIKCPRLAVLEGFHGPMKLNTVNLLLCEIYDCPRLYLGERYVYQRDTMIKELNLSGNNEIHLSDSTIPLLENQFKLFLTKEDFREVESLTCAPSVGVSCQHVILNLASLVILKITRCTNIISVTGLDNLSNLKCVSISFCPELCNWNDKTLPLSLKFLELICCDKLSSIPLLSVQNYSSTLEVLVITKCPRLDELVDFQGLMKLKTLDIRHCRNISTFPSLATERVPRPRINIGDCPLMRDWCQRNNITYNELNPIENSQDDKEAEEEGTGATTKD